MLKNLLQIIFSTAQSYTRVDQKLQPLKFFSGGELKMINTSTADFFTWFLGSLGMLGDESQD
jgi:hypothetical protein